MGIAEEGRSERSVWLEVAATAAAGAATEAEKRLMSRPSHLVAHDDMAVAHFGRCMYQGRQSVDQMAEPNNGERKCELRVNGSEPAGCPVSSLI